MNDGIVRSVCSSQQHPTMSPFIDATTGTACTIALTSGNELNPKAAPPPAVAPFRCSTQEAVVRLVKDLEHTQQLGVICFCAWPGGRLAGHPIPLHCILARPGPCALDNLAAYV
ncbi:unnamed protein product [Dibothriocephalus latus]|uniref:Uncharacterized protein n=1 Tax=Dibothriocephalus latus TaxID=60516 RepID=A0A3P7N496_DIBLA|nr:unnamed protein product [Dibothriocephalus latus]